MSKSPERTTDRRKHTYMAMMGVTIAVLYVLSVLLGLVYATVSNNIVYKSSFVMYAMDIGLQVLDVAVFSVGFSFFIYAVWKYQFRGALPFFGIYVALTVLRRLASLLLELGLSGAIGADDISSVAIYCVLDLLTCLAVIAIAALEFKKYNAYIKDWRRIRRDLGEDTTLPTLCPFESVFDKKNPLQVAAMKVGILLSGVKIASRIIFDLYIGVPQSLTETLIMIIYYLSDVLIGVVVYAVMLWLFCVLSREPKGGQE